MRLVLMSDTHLPKRAKQLPASVWRAVDEADLVIHAGDWVDTAFLDELEARAKRLIGVYGNNDFGAFRERLPLVAHEVVDGVRISVVHETGPSAGRDARMSAAYPDTDVLVFGHSHIPWDTATPSGLRLLNPGSPTDRRSMPTCTFMTAAISGGSLGDVQLRHVLDR